MSNKQFFERLEDRRLLSAAYAALTGGQLIVHGTGHGDSINMHKSRNSIVVTVDGMTQKFSAKKVHSFNINSGGGNDDVAVSSTITAPGTIYGSAGNDTLTAGGGDDTLNGGSGDDSLSGGNGPCTMAGGDGNDTLAAGSSDDSLNGGGGDDTVRPPPRPHGGHGGPPPNALALSDLPTAVQTTLTTDANGATLTDIFKWTEDDQTVYVARTDTTPPQFFEVDADGNNLPAGQGGPHDHQGPPPQQGGGGDNTGGNNSGGDNSGGDPTGSNAGTPGTGQKPPPPPPPPPGMPGGQGGDTTLGGNGDDPTSGS